MSLREQLTGKLYNGNKILKALELTTHAGYALLLEGFDDSATIITYCAAEKLAKDGDSNE